MRVGGILSQPWKTASRTTLIFPQQQCFKATFIGGRIGLQKFIRGTLLILTQNSDFAR